jgi:DNA-binding transcriptional LysR family regulator
MIFMELRHLRYFIAVAKHLSFSEASRRLHVAQAAISQTVLDLEDDLGAKLLVRSRRSVELTAAGNAFLAEAEAIVRRAEEARMTAQRTSRGELGTLRIGFSPAAAGPILSLLIKPYRNQFPKVGVQVHDLDSEEQLKAFEEKRIDVGLCRPPPKDRTEDFNVELIYEDRLQLLLPAGHALAKKRVVDLKDVADEIFVEGYRGGAPSLYGEVIATCRRAGFLPKVVFELEMANSVIFAVESGLGVSLVPGCVSHLHHRKTVLRPIRPASDKLPICAIWPAESHNPVLQSFLDVLRAAKPAIKKEMERTS